jgi:hypothetical protein
MRGSAPPDRATDLSLGAAQGAATRAAVAGRGILKARRCFAGAVAIRRRAVAHHAASAAVHRIVPRVDALATAARPTEPARGATAPPTRATRAAAAGTATARAGGAGAAAAAGTAPARCAGAGPARASATGARARLTPAAARFGRCIGAASGRGDSPALRREQRARPKQAERERRLRLHMQS